LLDFDRTLKCVMIIIYVWYICEDDDDDVIHTYDLRCLNPLSSGPD